MHTANSIENMSDQAAQKIAAELAVALFGTERFKTDLARKTGMTRQTINGWFAGRPSTLVILYMQAELARKEAYDKLANMKRALSGVMDAP